MNREFVDTADQIRALRDASKLKPTELAYWVAEAAASIQELKAALSKNAPTLVASVSKIGKDKEKNKDRALRREAKPVPDQRTFYAIEWVPTLPVHLDYVGRGKPDSWHHTIVAPSAGMARQMLIQKLTAERVKANAEAEQEADRAEAEEQATKHTKHIGEEPGKGNAA